MRFIWTKARIEDLKELSKIHTLQGAADILGCSRNQVWYKAKVLEIPFRKNGEKHHCSYISDEDVYLIRELKKEGLTRKEIAEKFEMKVKQIDAVLYSKYRRGDNYEPC